MLIALRADLLHLCLRAVLLSLYLRSTLLYLRHCEAEGRGNPEILY